MIDAREFAALWDAYRDRLLAFIARKVGSREDAEDILQETFARVHTGLCCFQEWKPMERWIYRVARNLIIDYYRGRNPTLEYKDDIESPGGGADAEDDPVAALAFSLRDMVNELPPPYREALALTEYEGLSQAEAAAGSAFRFPRRRPGSCAPGKSCEPCSWSAATSSWIGSAASSTTRNAARAATSSAGRALASLRRAFVSPGLAPARSTPRLPVFLFFIKFPASFADLLRQ